jgi:hypothetical protein
MPLGKLAKFSHFGAKIAPTLSLLGGFGFHYRPPVARQLRPVSLAQKPPGHIAPKPEPELKLVP